MRYSKTGKFTPKQQKLATEITERIKELRKSGIVLLAKQTLLLAYKQRDYDHAADLDDTYNKDYRHPVPSLDVGYIDDSGADDDEYFIKGYITEE